MDETIMGEQFDDVVAWSKAVLAGRTDRPNLTSADIARVVLHLAELTRSEWGDNDWTHSGEVTVTLPVAWFDGRRTEARELALSLLTWAVARRVAGITPDDPQVLAQQAGDLVLEVLAHVEEKDPF